MLEEKQKKIKEKLLAIFPFKIKSNDGGNNNKKKIENLIVFIVVLIITVISINLIWKTDNKKGKEEYVEDKILAKDDSSYEKNESIEEKLEDILKNIEGVGNVKVLLTYSESSKTLAMYNEDSSKNDTEETDSRWTEIEK